MPKCADRMTQPERKHRYSVVEIMITVVGIIVLIGLAVPAQRGLGVRANVARCVDAANAAGPSAQALLDRLATLPQCTDVRPYSDGSIVVTVDDARAAERPVFKLAPAADGRHELAWDCRQVSGDPRHMPAQCRSAPPATSSSGGSRGALPSA